MVLSPFAQSTFPDQALTCKSEFFLLYLNIMGHTCGLLFKEIYHESGREKKRDGQTRRDEQEEREMDGEPAKDGQWEVISKERTEMEGKTDGQIDTQVERESGNSWVLAMTPLLTCWFRSHCAVGAWGPC